MNRRAARGGFTLIELVVAMTIFLILMSTALGSYATVHKTMQRTENQEDLYQTGRVVLAQLSAELASAYQPPTTQTSALQGQDTPGSADQVQADTLVFLTTAHPADETRSRGDLTKVTYSMADSTKQEPAGLYVEQDLTPGLTPDNAPVDRHRLSPLVVSFNCKYLPATGDWLAQWTNQKTLPAAVRVELTLQDRLGKEKPITLVATTNLALATLPGTGGSASATQ